MSIKGWKIEFWRHLSKSLQISPFFYTKKSKGGWASWMRDLWARIDRVEHWSVWLKPWEARDNLSKVMESSRKFLLMWFLFWFWNKSDGDRPKTLAFVGFCTCIAAHVINAKKSILKVQVFPFIEVCKIIKLNIIRLLDLIGFSPYSTTPAIGRFLSSPYILAICPPLNTNTMPSN